MVFSTIFFSMNKNTEQTVLKETPGSQQFQYINISVSENGNRIFAIYHDGTSGDAASVTRLRILNNDLTEDAIINDVYGVGSNAYGTRIAVSQTANRVVNIYERINGTWTLQTLTPWSDQSSLGYRLGQQPNSIKMSDDGTLIFAGSDYSERFYSNRNYYMRGQVYILEYDAGTKTLSYKNQSGPDPTQNTGHDLMGSTIGINSNASKIVYGVTEWSSTNHPNHLLGNSDGYALVYDYDKNGNTFTQKGVRIEDDGGQGQVMGTNACISEDGNQIMVTDVDEQYIYTWNSSTSTWNKQIEIPHKSYAPSGQGTTNVNMTRNGTLFTNVVNDSNGNTKFNVYKITIDSQGNYTPTNVYENILETSHTYENILIRPLSSSQYIIIKLLPKNTSNGYYGNISLDEITV